MSQSYTIQVEADSEEQAKRMEMALADNVTRAALQVLGEVAHLDRPEKMAVLREVVEKLGLKTTPAGGEYKYGTALRLEGKLLPGEPWFALRAKDLLALDAVEEYANICLAHNLHDHAAGVLKALEQMKAWREANRDKVKIPD